MVLARLDYDWAPSTFRTSNRPGVSTIAESLLPAIPSYLAGMSCHDADDPATAIANLEYIFYRA